MTHTNIKPLEPAPVAEYQNRGGEIWEKTQTGQWIEIPAQTAIGRLKQLEPDLAKSRVDTSGPIETVDPSHTKNISITFQSEMEVIQQLCLKVFGASPIFKSTIAENKRFYEEAEAMRFIEGPEIINQSFPAYDITYALECQIDRLVEYMDELKSDLAEAQQMNDGLVNFLNECGLNYTDDDNAHLFGVWNSMRTAPYDNSTWILGYEESTGETGILIFGDNPEEQYPEDHSCVWTDGYRIWQPTNWMHLPNVPN